MEFGILILINIVMMAIFYLIVRIKLERSASAYREKKLKREIDEIINEFNTVAERNISILESKIAYMKGLMNKTGDLRSIDFKIEDVKPEGKGDGLKPDIQKEEDPGISAEIGTDIEKTSEINANDQMYNNEEIISKTILLKEGVFEFSNKTAATFQQYMKNIKQYINEKISTEKQEEPASEKTIPDLHEGVENADSNQNKPAGNLSTIDIVLEEDIQIRDLEENYTDSFDGPFEESTGESADNKLSHDADNDCNISETPGETGMDEAEIVLLFSNSDDKYTLIARLYDEGYPAEVITKCSGIPIGEIELVLDINNSI